MSEYKDKTYCGSDVEAFEEIKRIVNTTSVGIELMIS